MKLLRQLDAWRHRRSKQLKRNLRQREADALGEWAGADATIISNNCFGGRLYQDLDREYTTPTVGLFFIVADFVELCRNLRHYLTEATLTFKAESRSAHLNYKRDHDWRYHYPIGLLDGKIEIHFLHYKSEEEAREKWARRCGRVNWDNIVVTCLEINDIEASDFEAFETIPFTRKIFFTTEAHPGCPSTVKMGRNKRGEVGDGIKHTRRFYRAWLKKLRCEGDLK